MAEEAVIGPSGGQDYGAATRRFVVDTLGSGPQALSALKTQMMMMLSGELEATDRAVVTAGAPTLMGGLDQGALAAAQECLGALLSDRNTVAVILGLRADRLLAELEEAKVIGEVIVGGRVRGYELKMPLEDARQTLERLTSATAR